MPITEAIQKQETELEIKSQLKKTQPASSVDKSDISINEIVMPQIKGLEVLHEGTYTVDLEKTISDMLIVIKNMEAQLERVLELNSQYERELDYSKDMIIKLKSEKTELQNVITKLERQIPSKRELQIEIDHVEEEKNLIHNKYRDLSEENKKLKNEISKLKDFVSTFEEEKIDARMEIEYLEVQVKALNSKNQKYLDHINTLKGEKLSLIEKIKTLQDDLKQAYTDKFDITKNNNNDDNDIQPHNNKPPEKPEIKTRKAFSSNDL